MVEEGSGLEIDVVDSSVLDWSQLGQQEQNLVDSARSQDLECCLMLVLAFLIYLANLRGGVQDAEDLFELAVLQLGQHLLEYANSCGEQWEMAGHFWKFFWTV